MGQKIGKAIIVGNAQHFSNCKSFITLLIVIDIF